MKTFNIFVGAILLVCGANCLPFNDEDVIRFRAKESVLARKVLNAYYDKDLRPPGVEHVEDPIAVKTSLYLHELDFSPKKQSLTVGGYFRQKWTDVRLKSSDNEEDKKLTVKKFGDMFTDSQIWIPDTFVVQSTGGFVHDGPARSFLILKADGNVKSSFRLKAELNCPYGAEAEVECEMAFESYGYTSDDVSYEWDAAEVEISDSAKAHLHNDGWEVVGTQKKMDAIDLSTGRYSRVQFFIKLKKI